MCVCLLIAIDFPHLLRLSHKVCSENCNLHLIETLPASRSTSSSCLSMHIIKSFSPLNFIVAARVKSNNISYELYRFIVICFASIFFMSIYAFNVDCHISKMMHKKEQTKDGNVAHGTKSGQICVSMHLATFIRLLVYSNQHKN